MAHNYLPTSMEAYMLAPNLFTPPGVGYGLGFGMTLSEATLSGSVGIYGWSGAAHTAFFIDPKAELIAIFMAQLFPPDYKLEMMDEFRTAVYESVD